MPAKSKAQLRKAYADCAKGRDWGCKMAAHTKTTKGLPERKKRKKSRKKS
jgi:hypothetical protein